MFDEMSQRVAGGNHMYLSLFLIVDVCFISRNIISHSVVEIFLFIFISSQDFMLPWWRVFSGVGSNLMIHKNFHDDAMTMEIFYCLLLQLRGWFLVTKILRDILEEFSTFFLDVDQRFDCYVFIIWCKFFYILDYERTLFTN